MNKLVPKSETRGHLELHHCPSVLTWFLLYANDLSTFITYVCALIFAGFNVRRFRGLPAIRAKFRPRKFRHHGYARCNGRPNDDVAHRKNGVDSGRRQTPFSRLASSFAIVRFVLACCGVCIPSLSVPKRGSVSDLENVCSKRRSIGEGSFSLDGSSCEELSHWNAERN